MYRVLAIPLFYFLLLTGDGDSESSWVVSDSSGGDSDSSGVDSDSKPELDQSGGAIATGL